MNAVTKSERAWRWALRITGLCAFILSAVLLAVGREVPVTFLLIAAFCMGLDSIQGFELRRQDREGPR